MDACLAAIKSAANSDDLAKIIYSCIESPDLYTYSELLTENAVKTLLNYPDHARFYRLLQLFAYGTYEQYLSKKTELPELTPAMVQKLRQLTLVSMGMQHKQISVNEAMTVLHVDSVLELQAIFIGAVYAGILQGKWNTEKELIEIQSWRNRDVHPEELDAIRLRLAKWIEYCSNAIDGLENIAANAEKALAEAQANESKVEEEIKRIRKTLQDQEEDRTKDIRRPKMSRSQKYS